LTAFIHSHAHPHHDKEIKLFGGKPDEDVHQLKVKVADYEFELKKMGEDFAEFQLLAKMERDRHVKRLREELDFERSRNVEDNSKWEKKFAERKAQFEKDCDAYKAKVDDEAKRTNAENIAKLQNRHEEIIHKLNSTHEEAMRQIHKAMEDLKLDFEHRLKTERESHQRELLSMRKTHETVLKEKEEIF
jgi:hypothetical protein